MTEVRFYHMERSTLEQTLPALLTKARSQGHKILVKTQGAAQTEALNTHLWTYDPNSFLPHGSAKDGNGENQPILLTDGDENTNSASVLILTSNTTSEHIGNFKLCCEMLNGNNPEDVQNARSRWKDYKEKGFDITYWQQGQNGWEKKAG